MPKPPYTKFLQSSKACPNPLSPPTPPLTAVDRKFLQASNACPNPLRPHHPRPLCQTFRPKFSQSTLSFLAGFDACLCLSALGKAGHRPKRSVPALHTGYILLKRHIARVDQHSNIARLGVGGTGWRQPLNRAAQRAPSVAAAVGRQSFAKP